VGLSSVPWSRDGSGGVSSFPWRSGGFGSVSSVAWRRGGLWGHVLVIPEALLVQGACPRNLGGVSNSLACPRNPGGVVNSGSMSSEFRRRGEFGGRIVRIPDAWRVLWWRLLVLGGMVGSGACTRNPGVVAGSGACALDPEGVAVSEDMSSVP